MLSFYMVGECCVWLKPLFTRSLCFFLFIFFFNMFFFRSWFVSFRLVMGAVSENIRSWLPRHFFQFSRFPSQPSQTRKIDACHCQRWEDPSPSVAVENATHPVDWSAAPVTETFLQSCARKCVDGVALKSRMGKKLPKSFMGSTTRRRVSPVQYLVTCQ